MNPMNRPFCKKLSRRFSPSIRGWGKCWAAAVALALLCCVSSAEEKYVEVRLSSEADLFSAFPFGPMEPDASRLLKLIQRIETLREDDEVAGIVLRSSGSGVSRSDRYELAAEIRKFQKTGKKVVFWAPTIGGNGYLLAAQADLVLLPPSGMLDLTGVSASVMFYKDLMDKIGVKAEFVRAGDFKTAVEPYTRAEMSDEARAMMERMLNSLYEQMTTEVAAGRGMDIKKAERLIDGGPYTAKEALDAGLIDELRYPDELDEVADALAGKDVAYARSKPSSQTTDPESALFSHLLRGIFGGGDLSSGSGADKIALIHAEGVIAPDQASSPFLLGSVLTSADMVAALDKARRDSTVKAIVIRVNSPGGSALASDLIWRAVRRAREAKPVVVSMGNVAASGGYYIAMGADYIVANPGTLTGSVGVFGGKMDLGGLYDKIGVRKQVVKRGQNANIYDEASGFTDSERERLRSLIDAVYDDFTSKAAQGRSMDQKKIKELAKGQVWTGAEAVKNGLVDELGGLKEAFAAAKKRAGFSPEDKLELLELPNKPSLFSLFGEGASSALGTGEALAYWFRALEAMQRERVFMLLPYSTPSR